MKTTNETVDRKLSQAMTVEELIEALQAYAPETPVMLVSDYGDHCHTKQMLQIKQVEPASRAQIYETAYSDTGIGLHEEDEDGDWAKPQGQPACILLTSIRIN